MIFLLPLNVKSDFPDLNIIYICRCMEYNLIGKIYKYFSCICKEQRARIGVYSMKHTRRRLLAIVTAVFMALTVWMVPTGFAAADDITEIEWREGVTGGAIYFNKSTQTITKCDSAVTSAVIPSEIDGEPVTAIGSEAFAIFHLPPVCPPANSYPVNSTQFSASALR